MTKRRDAGTGQYISDETAKNQPNNTWVEETDNQIFLRRLYEDLMNKADYIGTNNVKSTTTEDIDRIFKKFGLKNG